MLPDRLKTLRLEAKLTQKQISKKLGIPQNSYSQYENGKRNIPWGMEEKLAEIYNVSTEYINGITDNPDVRESEYVKTVLEHLNVMKPDRDTCYPLLKKAYDNLQKALNNPNVKYSELYDYATGLHHINEYGKIKFYPNTVSESEFKINKKDKISNLDRDLDKSLDSFNTFDGKPINKKDREIIREVLNDIMKKR